MEQNTMSTPEPTSTKVARVLMLILLTIALIAALSSGSVFAIIAVIAGILLNIKSIGAKVLKEKINLAFPIGFVALIIGFVSMGNSLDNSKKKLEADKKKAEQAAFEALPEEQKTAILEKRKNEELKETFLKTCMSSWDGSNRAVVEFVKKNMNDPSSFEHVETKYQYYPALQQFLIVMDFRGKNAFGGKVKQSIKAMVSTDCQVVEIKQ